MFDLLFECVGELLLSGVERIGIDLQFVPFEVVENLPVSPATRQASGRYRRARASSTHNPEQIARLEFLFILRRDADLEAQAFIPATFVVTVHHFEHVHDPVGFPAPAKIRCDHLSEFLWGFAFVGMCPYVIGKVK